MTMKLNLNRSEWKKVKFGDIVKKVTNKIDPDIYDSDIVIQGGHINKRDFHIREYENKKELGYLGPAFHMGFKKKQILYVSRNPHLMKVGYPNFNGICANTTYILETIDDDILRNDLIPFLMHSDTFIEQSVANVRGGVNPYVNWSDLACIEFLLPPEKEQAKIAELLWAMDAVIEKEEEIKYKFEITISAFLKKIFFKANNRQELINLCIGNPEYGANSPAVEYDNDIRYLRITDIGNFGELNSEKVSAERHQDKFLLKYGDFLFARTADAGRSYYFKNVDGKCIFAGYLIRFTLNMSKILPEYLYYFTQTYEFKSWIKKITRTGTLSNINAKEFSKLMIPITTISKQKKIISEISYLYKTLKDINKKKASSRALQKELINQIF